MIGMCTRCGALLRVEDHHPTCRLAGRPIHPNLVVTICGPDCHAGVSELLRVLGLADPSDHPVVLLRRLALFLGWWGRPLEVQHVEAVAEVVADVADRIEVQMVTL